MTRIESLNIAKKVGLITGMLKSESILSLSCTLEGAEWRYLHLAPGPAERLTDRIWKVTVSGNPLYTVSLLHACFPFYLAGRHLDVPPGTKSIHRFWCKYWNALCSFWIIVYLQLDHTRWYVPPIYPLDITVRLCADELISAIAYFLPLLFLLSVSLCPFLACQCACCFGGFARTSSAPLKWWCFPLSRECR